MRVILYWSEVPAEWASWEEGTRSCGDRGRRGRVCHSTKPLASVHLSPEPREFGITQRVSNCVAPILAVLSCNVGRDRMNAGVVTLVDGAHGLGQLVVDLTASSMMFSIFTSRSSDYSQVFIIPERTEKFTITLFVQHNPK